MSIHLGSLVLERPVILAPMSGVSDPPFRRLVRRFGADLVVSEMILSTGVVMDSRHSRERAVWSAAEGPRVVQLAGRQPAAMAEAARLNEDQGAKVIDINMGCPVKKVIGGAAGSALMRDEDLALRLIEATVAAVGERIRVFTGNSANRGLAAVMMGAVGFVGAFEPQILGAEGISLFELSVSGKLDEARRVQNRTLAVNSAVRGIGTAPANLKAALNLIGRPGGHVRPPLLDLDEAQTEQMRRVVAEFGLLTLSAAE